MPLKLAIVNGPNLNLLGTRETNVYGSESLESLEQLLRSKFPEITFDFFQSNVEGDIINTLHAVGFSCNGIVINPGGYAHTSVAIADAIASIPSPVIEVHISNIYSRETYRHESITAGKCVGSISGLGFFGYVAAIEFLISHNQKSQH